MTHTQASLVIQTSHLGDAILTTPLIRRLAQRGPVDVVTTTSAAALLAGNPHIRNLFPLNKTRKFGRLTDMWALGRMLRHAQRHAPYRAAYHAQGSLRSVLIAMLGGVRVRVGFDTSAAAPLYTERIRYDGQLHHAHRLWQLAGSGTPDSLRPDVFPAATDRLEAETLIDGECHDPIVVIAPGSRRATKRWPYYVELAGLLPERSRIVIIGGQEDQHVNEEIAALCRRSGRTVLGAIGVPLLTAAALIERAQLVVCNDSVALHMAAAFDVPVLALFGPTVPAAGFAPLSSTATTLEASHLACRPCASRAPHACPLHHWRCMRDVAPATVALHAQRLLHREAVSTL